MLSRDDILAMDDLARELVTIPEWGNGQVYVRSLTSEEKDHWDAENYRLLEETPGGNLQNWHARLLVLAVCDEQGMPILTLSDAQRLGKKSAKVVQRLYDIAARLSGMREEDTEALQKNLSDPSGVSGFDLPPTLA